MNSWLGIIVMKEDAKIAVKKIFSMGCDSGKLKTHTDSVRAKSRSTTGEQSH